MNMLRSLIHQGRRSFWLLPLVGCFAGIGLAILMQQADRHDMLAKPMDLLSFVKIDIENARALFGTIAGAMATMMSLAYTLTLVVFTLAAGTLGPRLLDSFSDNRVNQITIAITGGTFLYSLTSLYLANSEHQARLSALIAIIAAAVSIGMLIYFVHDVAQRVLVDNEIARTSKRLSKSIQTVFKAVEEDASKDDKPTAIAFSPDKDVARIALAQRDGYVRSIDTAGIVKDAAAADAFIELLVAPGDFVVTNAPVARTYRAGDDTDWSTSLDKRFVMGMSRTSEDDVLFSVHLLVEIALRALSPGINDPYTAISCIDHLSAAFSQLLRRQAPSPVFNDDEGKPRLISSSLDIANVIGTAFHPLRRNSEGNVMVSSALLAAIERMATVSRSEYLDLLKEHAQMIAERSVPTDASPTDQRHVTNRLSAVEEAIDANAARSARSPESQQRKLS